MVLTDSCQQKLEWDEEDYLKDMIAQQGLHPDISAEFLCVSLESDSHLPFPAEEEEIIDLNATSEVAAANAELLDDDLQDVPRTTRDFPMPDLVEVDSSDDKDSDDKDSDDADNSNAIKGVPTNTISTMRNIPPAVSSNRPSANILPKNVSPALVSNRSSANTPQRNMPPTVASNRPSTNTPARNTPIKTPPTSTGRTDPR